MSTFALLVIASAALVGMANAAPFTAVQPFADAPPIPPQCEPSALGCDASTNATCTILSLQCVMNTVLADNANLRALIDTKQDAGDYLVRGTGYSFQIRSNGGNGHYYSIDYWAKDGQQPGWVKDGSLGPNGCGAYPSTNHRCVVLGI